MAKVRHELGIACLTAAGHLRYSLPPALQGIAPDADSLPNLSEIDFHMS
jgi:hypothetical protein